MPYPKEAASAAFFLHDNPSAPAGHLPLHKGGFGWVASSRLIVAAVPKAPLCKGRLWLGGCFTAD